MTNPRGARGDRKPHHLRHKYPDSVRKISNSTTKGNKIRPHLRNRTQNEDEEFARARTGSFANTQHAPPRPSKTRKVSGKNNLALVEPTPDTNLPIPKVSLVQVRLANVRQKLNTRNRMAT